MQLKPHVVLALSPHTDDTDIGCGASLAKWQRLGVEIHVVAFSDCKLSVPSGFPEDQLKTEFISAQKALGLPSSNYRLLDYEVRRFNERRQDILEDLVKLRAELAPDLVIAPSMHDLHQDHGVIAVEAFRAFKSRSIFAYSFEWNQRIVKSNAYVKVESEDVAKKVRMVSAYESQSHRDYMSKSFVEARAALAGALIGASGAEGFEVVRLADS